MSGCSGERVACGRFTVQQKILDHYHLCVSLREVSLHAKYLRTETACLPSAAGGPPPQQDNPRGQLDRIGWYSSPKAAPLRTVKENQIKLCPHLQRNPV